MSEPPLIEARGIVRRFGHVQALQGADFSVNRGEIVALIGDNGAGKSTLVRILSGSDRPNEGAIFVNGAQARFDGPPDARAAGIETVYQDLALAPDLDTAANMFLGREILKPGLLGRLGVLDTQRMARQAGEAMTRLGVSLRPSSVMFTLSGGQRQSVAVARAAMWATRVIFMDEPTAALGVAQTEQVLALVRRLGEQGLAVVIISHNLHDIFETADRITVLRLGRNVGLFERAKTTQQEVVEAITAGVPTKVSGIPTTAAAGAAQ